MKNSSCKKPIYWIVKNRSGEYLFDTISYWRKDTIKKFLEGTALTWQRDAKKHGWRVVKVHIQISPVID